MMDKRYKKYGNCDAQKKRIILDTGEITWGKIKEKAIQSYMETKPSSNRNSISKDYETQVCCTQAKQKRPQDTDMKEGGRQHRSPGVGQNWHIYAESCRLVQKRQLSR